MNQMGDYSGKPSFYRISKEISTIQEYLTDRSRITPNRPLPPALYDRLRESIVYLRDFFMTSGYHSEMLVAERCFERLSARTTLSEAKDILIEIVSLLSYADRHIVEGSLERRMKELEHELTRLRSQPALERKVAKLEKDLRKLRLASAISYEGNEKEQEDMLKKYKSAEKKVFVIMPFAPVFDDVWRGAIKRACNTEGFGCLRVDEVSLSTWITEDIEKYIEMADVVIADITANNPNVMFELGWALAKAKKPIVIRQQNDPNKVPFDVQGIRYISYVNSWSGIERLFTDICKFIRSTSETLSEEPTEKKKRKKTSKK